MMCGYVINRLKNTYKDGFPLIYILSSFCRYSHERPVLALPSTVADILADLHHLLLMRSNGLLTYPKINF